MSEIERWRGPESVDEHLAVLQAQARGETEPRFERAEYAQARRKVLEDAGLADADDDAEHQGEPDASEMTAADHFEALRKGRE